MSKKITIEEIKQRLLKEWGDIVILVESTYIDTHTKCSFIDKDFGPFEKTPLGVLRGRCRHSDSRKINIKKAQKIFNEDPVRSEIKQKKRIETTRAKFGVDNVFQSTEIQKKQKETVMRLYGADNVQKNLDVRAKSKATCMEKYGVEHTLSDKGIREDIKKTCLSKYGAETTLQTPAVKSAREAATVKYKLTNGTTMSQLCKNNDIPYTSGLKTFLSGGEPALFSFVSKYEKYYSYIESIVKNALEPELKLKKFDRLVIPGFNRRPDFELIPEKLYLNTDGLYWHCDKVVDKYYHLELRKEFEKNGIRIIQLYEDEIACKTPIIRSMILNSVGLSNKIHARKCKIDYIDTDIGSDFCTVNHLMGPGDTKRGIGLRYKGELVSFLSYKIYTDRVEIVRFCSLLNTSVVGGFSKLLSIVENASRRIGIKKIVTFCDLRYATGVTYEKAGFFAAGETLGWQWVNGTKRFNRLHCRAGNGKTEKENAELLKLNKIYDAGQRKYIKEIL